MKNLKYYQRYTTYKYVKKYQQRGTIKLLVFLSPHNLCVCVCVCVCVCYTPIYAMSQTDHGVG